MMWHVLMVDRHVHLANPGPPGSSSIVTDLDGAARLGYILSGMQTPWSLSPNISSPSGAGIWRIETVTQSVQVLALWFLAQIADPMFAANLLVFGGWVATGVMVFLIVRELEGSHVAAAAAVLVVQTLPSARFMAANFTSYVWLAIPLLVVFSLLRFARQPSLRSLLGVGLSLVVSAFFDPYWAYFSLLILVVCSSVWMVKKAIRRTSRRALLESVAMFGFGVSCFLLVYILSKVITNSSNSREIQVATWVDARNSALSLEAWLTSDVMGVGPLLLGLFLLSLIAIVVFQRGHLYAPVAVSVVMTIVSIRFVFPQTEHEIVPAGLLRHFMPGVRFFDRASLIGTALAVVLSAVVIETLIRRISTRRLVRATIAALLFTSVIGVNGVDQPASSRSYHDWADIREVLEESDKARLVALPFTRRGRDWIEQASFRTPMVNDYVHAVNDPEVVLQASHGVGSLAASLSKLGATHALVVISEFERLFDYQLAWPRFAPVRTIKLNGFGEGEDFVAVLLRVTPSRDDTTCENCGLGPHLIPDIRVAGDLVYPPDIGASGDRWWWVGEGDVTLRLSSLPLPQRTRAHTSWTVRVSLAPCASAARVTVFLDGKAQIKELSQTKPTEQFRVGLNRNLVGLVTMEGSGQSCVPAGDNRAMLYQISATSD